MKRSDGVAFVSMQLNFPPGDEKPFRWPESILITEEGICVAGYINDGWIVKFNCWEFLAHCINMEGQPEITPSAYQTIEPSFDVIDLEATLTGPLW